MPPALKLITDPTPESASTAEFVDAMSALASGVVLVTCWVGDRPWGMTVTAFASVSADPPTVLVSLGSADDERARDHGDAKLRRQHPRRGAARRRPPRLGAGRDQVPRAVRRPGRREQREPGRRRRARPPRLRARRRRPGRRPHDLLRPRSRCTGVTHGGTPLLYHRRAYRTLGDRAAGRPPTERKLRCLSS